MGVGGVLQAEVEEEEMEGEDYPIGIQTWTYLH